MNENLKLIELIDKFNEITVSYNEQNKIESLDFNVFCLVDSVYGIKETKHSKFLSFFLDPKGSHGQGSLFLKEFLDLLNIEFIENEKWNIAAEKENIDILLTSKRSTIIIENKSNWAIDQENQLYRYWYRKIFDKYKNYSDESILGEFDRIVYLAPHVNKKIDSISLRKPDEINCDVKMLNEEDITCLYFNSDILNWLNRCLEKIESLKIKLLVQDYIGFWKQTSLREKKIMEELKKYLEGNKQNWESLIQSINYIDRIREKWILYFIDNLEKETKIKSWKFKNVSGTNDFRWYLGNESDVCFVYEFHLGLSVWKQGFNFSKSKFKDKFEKLLPEFKFNTNEKDSYIMKYSIDNNDLEFSRVDDFAWDAGNETEELVSKIKDILVPLLENEDVISLFRDVDSFQEIS